MCACGSSTRKLPVTGTGPWVRNWRRASRGCACPTGERRLIAVTRFGRGRGARLIVSVSTATTDAPSASVHRDERDAVGASLDGKESDALAGSNRRAHTSRTDAPSASHLRNLCIPTTMHALGEPCDQCDGIWQQLPEGGVRECPNLVRAKRGRHRRSGHATC
jgi:hypothetical protein